MLMLKPVKYAIFFLASYLLLSFPISGKPLFAHFYQVSKHATSPVYQFMIAQTEKAYDGAKTVVKKLFYNAKPSLSIDPSLTKSEPLKEVEIQGEEEQEKITDHEREMLSTLLSK